MSHGHFGVDFASSDLGLLDRAIAAYGPVSWVGQYLPVYPTNAARVAAIHARGAATLPIWNKDQTGSRTPGPFEWGHADALEAAAAWRGIGLPSHSIISLDVENSFFLNGEYLRGWLVGMAESSMTGSAYINPPNGLNHAAAWRYARQQGAKGIVFTSQNQFNGQEDTPIHEFVVDVHTGAYPVWGYEGDTGIRQTSIGGLGRTIDLDVASDAAYALMWGAAKPAPITTLRVQTILRTVPRTNGKHAKSPEHPDGLLPAGTVLHSEPDPSQGQYHGLAETIHWSHYLIGKGPMHGWCEKASTQTVGG